MAVAEALSCHAPQALSGETTIVSYGTLVSMITTFVLARARMRLFDMIDPGSGTFYSSGAGIIIDLHDPMLQDGRLSLGLGGMSWPFVK